MKNDIIEQEFPWDGFKGTKEEWAWYYIENHILPTAKDYDNVEEEVCFRLILQTKKELEKENAELKKQVENIRTHLLSECKNHKETLAEIDRLKSQLEKAKDALKFTLFFAEYVTQPDKELEKGMAPFFYHTLTYEGDLELIERVKQIRQTLAELESK